MLFLDEGLIIAPNSILPFYGGSILGVKHIEELLLCPKHLHLKQSDIPSSSANQRSSHIREQEIQELALPSVCQAAPITAHTEFMQSPDTIEFLSSQTKPSPQQLQRPEKQNVTSQSSMLS